MTDLVRDAGTGDVYCSRCGDAPGDCPCTEENMYQAAQEEIAEREGAIVADYEARAKAERDAGGRCDVNHGLPYVSVVLADGTEYFFQGDEAENLITEAEEALGGGLWPEDYILAVAQGW